MNPPNALVARIEQAVLSAQRPFVIMVTVVTVVTAVIVLWSGQERCQKI
jgi:hypothetical protein